MDAPWLADFGGDAKYASLSWDGDWLQWMYQRRTARTAGTWICKLDHEGDGGANG